MTSDQTSPAEPLLAVDRDARDLFKPYLHTPPVRVLKVLGQVGDQAQMRILSGSVVALGLVRSDPRMMLAGARMLLSHELATLTKNALKHRLERRRPRSAPPGAQAAIHEGHSHAKERTSFPSGHSAGAMAGAAAVAAIYPEHRTAARALGLSVGVAQVPTSAHYPTDVAAGLTIGALADAAVGIAASLAARAALALLANHLLTRR